MTTTTPSLLHLTKQCLEREGLDYNIISVPESSGEFASDEFASDEFALEAFVEISIPISEQESEAMQFSLLMISAENEFGDSYLRLTISPFIKSFTTLYTAEEFINFFEINRNMSLVKFSVDDDGDLLLSGDILETALTPDHFSKIVQLICDYTHKHYFQQNLEAE